MGRRVCAVIRYLLISEQGRQELLSYLSSGNLRSLTHLVTSRHRLSLFVCFTALLETTYIKMPSITHYQNRTLNHLRAFRSIGTLAPRRTRVLGFAMMG